MIRCFAALALPDPVADDLAGLQAGLPAGRAVAPENLHLTLGFFGEQREPVVEDLHLALGEISVPAPEIEIAGLGMFGGAQPRSLHAEVRPEPGLKALRARVQQAARGAGIAMARAKFVPHVTLARFPATLPPEDLAALHRFVAARMGRASARFVPDHFTLYRSHLTRSGPEYEALAEYPLGRERAV